MKSPKDMSPQEAVEAAQIGRLLAITIGNAKRTRNPDRVAAAEYWEGVVQEKLAKHFTQRES